MRFLLPASAMFLAVMMSSANAFQMGPPDPGSPGGETQVPWRFTHPQDGMEVYGNVLFSGTGPDSDIGGLSVYSYTNIFPGEVYASELQLQIAVIVDTDPGIDWMGPTYDQVGEGYATIMPALGTPNMILEPLVDGEGTGETGGMGVSTLTSVSGGQGVLFRILEP